MSSKPIRVLFLIIVCTACCRQLVSAQDAPTVPAEETPLSPQATQFIRGMALILLPHTYTDDDDWGKERRIQSGLNVKMDGLKVRTSRRWKDVNHGIWRQVDAKLVEPEKHFQLSISTLPPRQPEVPRYRINASMRLRIKGRQQHWNLGAKLYSISTAAVADVAIATDVRFHNEILNSDGDTKLRVLPFVETAAVRLKGFRLNRISHAKGGVVRELGNAMESVIRRAVQQKSLKLARKINEKILKKPERFEIPAGVLAMFGSKKENEPQQPSAAKSD